MIIDVVIPVYRPGKRLEECVKRLSRQTVPVRKIYLVVTVERESDMLDERQYRRFPQAEIIVIPGEEFDHGAVRDRWMRQVDAEIVMFMAQDAVPKDDTLVEKLLQPFEDEGTVMVYGRHITDQFCDEIERYTRYFNYPPVSEVKTKADEERLGIKTYFCSNVCAAYRREAYLRTSGFGDHMIASEDMLYAWKALQAGGKLAYAAEAEVIHYHRYSGWRQWKRNFDIGVVHADHPEVFRNLSSEKEGIRLVKETAGHLLKKKKIWLLIPLAVRSTAKYAGYQMGKHYRVLPRRIILFCTGNQAYWKKEVLVHERRSERERSTERE